MLALFLSLSFPAADSSSVGGPWHTAELALLAVPSSSALAVPLPAVRIDTLQFWVPTHCISGLEGELKCSFLAPHVMKILA